MHLKCNLDAIQLKSSISSYIKISRVRSTDQNLHGLIGTRIFIVEDKKKKFKCRLQLNKKIS